MISAIDVSSWQPRDLSGIIADHQPQHVVVRLYLPEESPPQDHTRGQIASAIAAGCTVGGYVWCYRYLDPERTVRDAIALARSCDVVLPVLWLDCEDYRVDGELSDPGPDAAWLRAAVAACDDADVLPGIYTAKWWWIPSIDTDEFAVLLLWAAHYDGVPTLSSVPLFGGWEQASGKQYASTPVDQNVFEDSVTEVGMTAAQKATVLTAASQLETIALRQQRAAAAVATVGAGEPWQYRDLLAERDAEELRALALRLQQAAGE